MQLKSGDCTLLDSPAWLRVEDENGFNVTPIAADNNPNKKKTDMREVFSNGDNTHRFPK